MENSHWIQCNAAPIFHGHFSNHPRHDKPEKPFLFVRHFDFFILIWLAIANAAAFGTFAFDKWRAGCSSRRVAESTLVLLGALGGWPGGLLAMKLFRHKTVKRTFQFKYALALVPFAAEIWAWLHWR